MNDRTKKVLIWGSVITLLGVSGYLGYRFFKNRKTARAEEEAKKLAEAQALIAQQNQNQGGGGGGNQGGGGGAVVDRPSEVDTTDKLKAFQKWVINTKGDKTILGKGGDSGFGDDGTWGNKSKVAWAKYGEEFKKTLKPVDTPTKPVISESLQKDIDTVVAMGVGEKAKRAYLEGGIDAQSKKDWVSSWARALRANKADPAKGTTFVWNTGGQDWGLYEAYSGTKVLGFNPTDRKPKPLSEAYFYEKPEVSSFSYVQATGNNAGTVKGYQYNNKTKKLWLYIPIPMDSKLSDAWIMGTKWILANEVKF